MSEVFPVFPNDIVQQIKLSLQLPEIVNAIVTRQLVNTASTRSGIQVDSVELQQTADAFRLKHDQVTLPNLRIAQETYQAIEANEIKFHEVLQRFGSDENRRTNRYWGTFLRSRLPHDLATAIFSPVPPTVLSPTSTALIFVEILIQPELTETLRAQILQELFSQWARKGLDRLEIRLEL
jgi:hypothetical protein